MIEAIIEERCNGCEICVLSCPKNVIQFDKERRKPFILNAEKCDVCYNCITSCAVNAVIVTDQKPVSPPPR